MNTSEMKEAVDAAKVLAQLNVMEFLKMIEEKAKAWKKELANG